MPRGNDAADAARELAERYKTTGNAEDLIRSNRLSRSRALNAAGLKGRDEEASAELDLDKVEKAADLPDGSRVVGAAVRGGVVTYVAEVPAGNGHHHTVKGVLERSGTKGALKPSEPEADEAAELAQAQAEAATARAAREAREEAEEKAREAEEKAAEVARKAAEEGREAAAKQAEKAEKAAAKAED